MVRLRPKFGSGSAWRLLLVLLCIALVVVSGTVMVAHSHPDRVFHADCALCATAHVVVQVTVPPVTIHVTHVESLVETLVLPSSQGAILTFALFTRPPPANAVPA